MATSHTHPPDELDELLSTLSDRRARAVCRYLRSVSADVASLEDLARSVCDQLDQGTDPDRVKLHLHHATLPKLSAAGVLDYDAREQRVRYDGSELLEAWFDSVLESKHVAV